MIRINQVKVRPGHSEADLKRKAAEILKVSLGDIAEMRIIRQSVDARKKPDIFFIYTLLLDIRNEEKILKRFKGKEAQVAKENKVFYHFPKPGRRVRKGPTVIVGMGPAGLFCGYFLALHGYKPILLERGKCVEERQQDVERFWEEGRLHPNSNVQFGEGGAGTFSDGKLNTLIKDKDGRNRIVLRHL